MELPDGDRVTSGMRESDKSLVRESGRVNVIVGVMDRTIVSEEEMVLALDEVAVADAETSCELVPLLDQD